MRKFISEIREPRRGLWCEVAFTKVVKMRTRIGNCLLLVSVLIAGGWVVFAAERLGARMEEWERVFVVAGLIVLVGLALATFLLARRKARWSDLKVSLTALCLGLSVAC